MQESPPGAGPAAQEKYAGDDREVVILSGCEGHPPVCFFELGRVGGGEPDPGGSVDHSVRRALLGGAGGGGERPSLCEVGVTSIFSAKILVTGAAGVRVLDTDLLVAGIYVTLNMMNPASHQPISRSFLAEHADLSHIVKQPLNEVEVKIQCELLDLS